MQEICKNDNRPMGINYEDRVYDLVDYANINYGVDSLQMRIIAASLIPMDYPFWLACDAQEHIFWEHLNSAIKVSRNGFPIRNIAWLRVQSPRIANMHISKLIDERKTRPLVYYDRTGHLCYSRRAHPRHMYNALLEECLRIRVPLATLRLPDDDAEYELTRLMKLVINAEFRTERPRLERPNEALTLYASLVYKLNPELSNGSSFIRNVCMIPHAHRVLFGRDKLTDEDWRTQYHVLLQCIRSWDYQVLKAFVDNDCGYMDIAQVRECTGMARYPAVSACRRLHDSGILVWPKKGKAKQGRRYRWIGVNPDLRYDIGEFLSGRARWW